MSALVGERIRRNAAARMPGLACSVGVARIVVTHSCRPGRSLSHRILFTGRSAQSGAFEEVIGEAEARLPMRVLAWCMMPNHWHFVLRPRGDGDLSEFMRWLTVTHTQRTAKRLGLQSTLRPRGRPRKSLARGR